MASAVQRTITHRREWVHYKNNTLLQTIKNVTRRYISNPIHPLWTAKTSSRSSAHKKNIVKLGLKPFKKAGIW
jgi:hypothetical protein